MIDTTGRRLMTIRISREMSCEEFGALLGLKALDIAHLESEDFYPPLDFQIRLKYRFPEVDLYWFKNGDGPPIH